MFLFYKNFDKSGDLWYKSEHLKKTHSEHVSRKSQKWSMLGYMFVLSICLLFVVVFDNVFLHAFSVSMWRFAWFYFIMLFLAAKKLLDRKIYLWRALFYPKDFLFLTSFIVIMWVYWTLALQLIVFKIFIAFLVWFIFFFVWASIVKDSNKLNIFGLLFTKLYMFILGIFVVVLWAQAMFYGTSTALSNDVWSLWTMVWSWFWWPSIVDSDNSDMSWSVLVEIGWEVVSTSLDWTWWIVIVWEDVVSDVIANDDWTGVNIFVSESTDVIASSGDVVSFENMEPDSFVTEDADGSSASKKLDVPELPTMMDVLIYLVDAYDVPLSQEKNIRFTYVSTKNPYYAEFRTAYDNLLIGKTVNPSKNVLCQTYIVMKWLLEDWDVGSYTDIKSAYRKEAQDRWVLNGCKWNFYVKNVSL